MRDLGRKFIENHSTESVLVTLAVQNHAVVALKKLVDLSDVFLFIGLKVSLGKLVCLYWLLDKLLKNLVFRLDQMVLWLHACRLRLWGLYRFSLF